jgi:hypothetical protein
MQRVQLAGGMRCRGAGRRALRSTLVATGLGAALLVSVPAAAATTAPAHPPRVSWLAKTLAAQGHQSLAAVEALRAKDGSWLKVAAALKIPSATFRADAVEARRRRGVAAETVAVLAALGHSTPAAVRALEGQGLTAQQVAARLHLAWPAVQTRLAAVEKARADARIRDRALTAFLAQLTGKPAAAIAALKDRKGVTWLDVAHDLGFGVHAASPPVAADH